MNTAMIHTGGLGSLRPFITGRSQISTVTTLVHSLTSTVTQGWGEGFFCLPRCPSLQTSKEGRQTPWNLPQRLCKSAGGRALGTRLRYSTSGASILSRDGHFLFPGSIYGGPGCEHRSPCIFPSVPGAAASTISLVIRSGYSDPCNGHL